MTFSDTPPRPSDDAVAPDGAVALHGADTSQGTSSTPANPAPDAPDAPAKPPCATDEPDDHGGPTLFGGLR